MLHRSWTISCVSIQSYANVQNKLSSTTTRWEVGLNLQGARNISYEGLPTCATERPRSSTMPDWAGDEYPTCNQPSSGEHRPTEVYSPFPTLSNGTYSSPKHVRAAASNTCAEHKNGCARRVTLRTIDTIATTITLFVCPIMNKQRTCYLPSFKVFSVHICLLESKRQSYMDLSGSIVSLKKMKTSIYLINCSKLMLLSEMNTME